MAASRGLVEPPDIASLWDTDNGGELILAGEVADIEIGPDIAVAAAAAAASAAVGPAGRCS